MDDLTAFLTARLDEDEHYLQTMIEAGERYAALATAKDTADAYGMAMAVADDPQVRKLLVQALEGVFRPPNDLHEVLRDVEAKRAILALHAAAPRPSPRSPDCRECQRAPWPCRTLRHLAAVYSDHPDYRQEWKAE